MPQTIALILLGIVALLAYSYFFMKKSRKRLFQRVAAFTVAEIPGFAVKFRDYLSREHPEAAAQPLADLAPLMEQLLKKPFSYLKLDPHDNDAMVFAIGSHLGERIASEHTGRWEQSDGKGPALVIGTEEAQVTMYPIEKAAGIQEFGAPGDLLAYILTCREVADELNRRAGTTPP